MEQQRITWAWETFEDSAGKDPLATLDRYFTRPASP
jgi:hypothetical protein